MRFVVIADDMPGGNAVGAAFRGVGLEAEVLISPDAAGIAGIKSDCGVLHIGSRGIDAQSAYERVLRMARLANQPGVRLFAKRIDPGLRGNLGTESDGVLDALGRDFIGIVAVCSPAAGCATIGGRLLQNGLPLHRNPDALDSANLVISPVVADNFGRQTKNPIANIFVEELSKGVPHLAQMIAEKASAGARLLVFDAISYDDLDIIAKSAIESGVKFVPIDPGAFTAICAANLAGADNKAKPPSGKVLVVIGSTNSAAANQVFKFLDETPVHNVFVNIERLLRDEGARESAILQIELEISKHAEQFDVLSIVGSGIYPENRLDFDRLARSSGIPAPRISEIVNETMARIAFDILAANPGFSGIYASGSDTAIAVCRRLGAESIEITGEAAPAAAVGRIRGGQFSGLNIITKGGMGGDVNALIDCVAHLRGW
ncbi:MAG: hypothetical protein FWB71_00855 [Defluviitaleaceae bacterium]|nr:hypothetical protein [Defluviitaleaceae bacterium]